jgi:multiple sugar transport system permease protein
MKASAIIKFIFVTIVTIILIGYFDLPIIVMIVTAFKQRADIFTQVPKWIFTPTLSNFADILAGTTTLAEGPIAIRNSLFFVTSSTLIAMFLGSLAAYGFSRFNFFGKDDLLFFILSQRFMPVIVIALPMFVLFSSIGLRGTPQGLILIYINGALPFAIWMMKSFFDEVPKEIDEAARLDGYSYFTIFRKFVLPVTRNGFLATFLFSFIFTWGEFLFALILTTPESWTMPIAIVNSRVSSQILWGQIAAYGVISIIPVFIIAIALQKYLVRGMTLGAVK